MTTSFSNNQRNIFKKSGLSVYNLALSMTKSKVLASINPANWNFLCLLCLALDESDYFFESIWWYCGFPLPLGNFLPIPLVLFCGQDFIRYPSQWKISFHLQVLKVITLDETHQNWNCSFCKACVQILFHSIPFIDTPTCSDALLINSINHAKC